MNERPEWFAPRRYGLGAGRPIAWQGWAVLAVFLLLVAVAILAFGPTDPLALTIVVPAIAALLVVVVRTTRGGWHWRWGERE